MTEKDIVIELEALGERIVELLEELSRRGKVEWFRSHEDSAMVFCLTGYDLLAFDLNDGTEENLKPFENTHGIGLDFRNQKLLWLEGMHNWDSLLALVKKAPIKEGMLGKAKYKVTEKFVENLELLLK